jgi:hypothetical protein
LSDSLSRPAPEIVLSPKQYVHFLTVLDQL